jgi:hypothetical protein
MHSRPTRRFIRNVIQNKTARLLVTLFLVFTLPLTITFLNQQQNIVPQAATLSCTFNASKQGTNSIASSISIPNPGSYDRVEFDLDPHNTATGQYLGDSYRIKKWATIANGSASTTFTGLDAGYTYKAFAQVYSTTQGGSFICSGEKWIEIIETTNPTATPTPGGNTYTISGKVINDETNSGVNNVRVWVQKSSGVSSTKSDNTSSTGSYSITGLTAGTYGVHVDEPSGWDVVSNNDPTSVTIGPNKTVNFDLQQRGTGGINPSPTRTPTRTPTQSQTTTKTPTRTPTTSGTTQTISGLVWNDKDGGGDIDLDSESGISNIQLYVLGSAGNPGGATNTTVRTNSTGNYTITVNRGSSYTIGIRQTDISGWAFTTVREKGPIYVTSNIDHINFGLRSTVTPQPSQPSDPDPQPSPEDPQPTDPITTPDQCQGGSVGNGGRCSLSCQCQSNYCVKDDRSGAYVCKNAPSCTQSIQNGYACEDDCDCISGLCANDPNAIGQICKANPFTPGEATILALDISTNAGNDGVSALSSQQVTVQLLDSNKVRIKEAIGTLSYNETTQGFTGTVTFTDLPTGNYIVTAKLQNSLQQELYELPIGISTSATNQMPQVTLPLGDVNNDNMLDIRDFNILYDCIGGLLSCSEQTKSLVDLNNNQIIDILDYNIFLNSIPYANDL